MAVSARDVAAALRERLKGMSKLKVHKLLYYCQGHHLAGFDEQIFRETVSAWDHGPVVGEFWFAEREGPSDLPPAPLDQGQLNTVGYVVSRYGRLTERDLINLTHAEDPWRLANQNRRPRESARIRVEWMRDFFAQDSFDEDEEPLDSEAVSNWLAEAAAIRPTLPPRTNTREEILARLQRV